MVDDNNSKTKDNWEAYYTLEDNPNRQNDSLAMVDDNNSKTKDNSESFYTLEDNYIQKNNCLNFTKGMCNELPYDREAILHDIGIKECQELCRTVYEGTCTYFLYDRDGSCTLWKHNHIHQYYDSCAKQSGPLSPNVDGHCGNTYLLESKNSCDAFRYTGCDYFEVESIGRLTDILNESVCQLACSELKSTAANCHHYQYNAQEATCLLYGPDFASYCTQIAGIPNRPVEECSFDPFNPFQTKVA